MGRPARAARHRRPAIITKPDYKTSRQSMKGQDSPFDADSGLDLWSLAPVSMRKCPETAEFSKRRRRPEFDTVSGWRSDRYSGSNPICFPSFKAATVRILVGERFSLLKVQAPLHVGASDHESYTLPFPHASGRKLEVAVPESRCNARRSARSPRRRQPQFL